jgi:hypothetical protein
MLDFVTHRRAAKTKCETCLHAATRSLVDDAVEAMVKNPVRFRQVSIASLHEWARRSTGYAYDYHAFYRHMTKARCGDLWARVTAARGE